MPFAQFDPSPMPFVALMALGFLVGILGHVYDSKAAVASGIALVFVATLLLPLGIYLTS